VTGTSRPVVFDAAGTLLEVAGSVAALYAETARAAGGAFEVAAIERGFARAFSAAPPLAFGLEPGPALRAAERGWWRAVARGALESAGTWPETFDFERFFDLAFARFAEPGAWRVRTDVRPALRALRAAGRPLAVLSNWDTRLPPLLDALGLGGYFALVAVSSAVGAAKPDRAVFDFVATALEDTLAASAGPPIMVGDRLDHDIEPARGVGWDAVWLDRRGAGDDVPAGVPRVADLRELPERLARLA